MYTYIECHKDLTEYFRLWNVEDNEPNSCTSSISLEAEKVFTEDIASLTEIQVNFLKGVLDSIDVFSEYKLYIITYYGVSSPVSSVARYKKLWKRIDGKIDLSGLEKSKEIEISVAKGSIFCGLLQLNENNIEKAIKIVNELDGMCVLVASKSEMMAESEIVRVFHNVLLCDYNKDLLPEVYKIDYRRLCLDLCEHLGLVVRLGNAAEEVSFAIFLNEILYEEVIGKVDFKEFMDLQIRNDN